MLLAKDELGYANLCKLVSAAHLDRPIEQEPHVEFGKLDGLSDGLIALTAGAEGAVARLLAEGQRDKAEAYLDRLQALFPGPALCRDHPARTIRSSKPPKTR